VVFNTGSYTVLPDNSILITANRQSETGFPSSHQLKSYVASKSRLKLAARAVLSADAGLLVLYGCEIWCMSPSDKHKVDVEWDCFRKVLTLVGVKVLSHCYFIAILCLLHYWLNREKLFCIIRLYTVTILFRVFCVLCIVMRLKNCLPLLSQ